jgi:hypothetical protein
MSHKCPACGFDSPDGAQWCDMCKEPFQKKTTRPTPAAAAAAHAAAAELAANLPPADVKDLKKLPPEELFKRLPLELSRDGGAGDIPKLPPWFLTAAYVFIAALAIMTVLLITTTLFKAHQLPPPEQRQAPPP